MNSRKHFIGNSFEVVLPFTQASKNGYNRIQSLAGIGFGSARHTFLLGTKKRVGIKFNGNGRRQRWQVLGPQLLHYLPALLQNSIVGFYMKRPT